MNIFPIALIGAVLFFGSFFIMLDHDSKEASQREIRDECLMENEELPYKEADVVCRKTVSKEMDYSERKAMEACLMENEELSYKEAKIACKKDVDKKTNYSINTKHLPKEEADLVRRIARRQADFEKK